MKNFLIGLVVILVVAIIGLAFWIVYTLNSTQPTVACTMESKICADGSAVGRSGPNCEFAACPAIVVTHPGWLTGNDAANFLTFQYPAKLDAAYIGTSTTEWPPIASVSNNSYYCSSGSGVSSLPSSTLQQVISGRTYCVTTLSEGAAGSTYITYTYTSEVNVKQVTLKFTLQFPQCLNYDDPQKTACQQERQAFDINALADEMMQTVKLK